VCVRARARARACVSSFYVDPVFTEFLRNLVWTVYFGTAPAFFIHCVVISCNEHQQAAAGNLGVGIDTVESYNDAC
jgi:hypothetical protein